MHARDGLRSSSSVFLGSKCWKLRITVMVHRLTEVSFGLRGLLCLRFLWVLLSPRALRFPARSFILLSLDAAPPAGISEIIDIVQQDACFSISVPACLEDSGRSNFADVCQITILRRTSSMWQSSTLRLCLSTRALKTCSSSLSWSFCDRGASLPNGNVGPSGPPRCSRR